MITVNTFSISTKLFKYQPFTRIQSFHYYLLGHIPRASHANDNQYTPYPTTVRQSLPRFMSYDFLVLGYPDFKDKAAFYYDIVLLGGVSCLAF